MLEDSALEEAVPLSPPRVGMPGARRDVLHVATGEEATSIIRAPLPLPPPMRPLAMAGRPPPSARALKDALGGRLQPQDYADLAPAVTRIVPTPKRG